MLERFAELHRNSRALFDEAAARLAGGVNRDVVYMAPHPIFMIRGSGGRTFDVDGNSYVDTICGNGALLFGHGHAAVTEKVVAQVRQGLHLGSCAAQEVEWAKQVQELIPCAETIRFTSTGSEATHLAIRLARAYTGRSKYVRFAGHYHGWHDGVAVGSNLNRSGADSAGVPGEIVSLVRLVNGADLTQLDRLLDNDIAAVILEPSGGKAGLNPLEDGFLAWLRNACTERRILLVFDEVISGFRWAAGGAQQCLNIIPDLTTLGKILGGGFTCGAVVGRRDIMDQLSFLHEHNQSGRVHHGGTFSGNLVAATAGTCTLQLLKDGSEIHSLNRTTAVLRTRLNDCLITHRVRGLVYGQASVFHVSLDGLRPPKKTVGIDVYDALRIELANGGVLMRRMTGMLCAAHTADDLDQIVCGFDTALSRLQAQGYLDPVRD